MINQNNEQLAYEAPQVVDFGRLADITAGNADGEFTDAEFPVKTPQSQLTFS